MECLRTPHFPTSTARITIVLGGSVWPGPGIEQRLAEDGEIMFRGRNVMKEYYKNREATADVLTHDGWLYTGDLGEIDSKGFLKIIGRKKDLIITAGGENVAPAAIEELIASSKYINQVCVVGDRRKYLTALVTLTPDNVGQYAKEAGIKFHTIDELIINEKILQLIDSEVMKKNRELASFETLKKVAVVPEFTIENDFLTPTLKIKRKNVIIKYEKIINSLYTEI